MENKNGRQTRIIFIAVCAVMVATQSFGFDSVATGDVGYEFYNMAAKMSTGPIGKTVGLGGLALSCFFLFKQQILPSVGTAMGAMGFAKSVSILDTFGGTF